MTNHKKRWGFYKCAQRTHFPEEATFITIHNIKVSDGANRHTDNCAILHLVWAEWQRSLLIYAKLSSIWAHSIWILLKHSKINIMYMQHNILFTHTHTPKTSKQKHFWVMVGDDFHPIVAQTVLLKTTNVNLMVALEESQVTPKSSRPQISAQNLVPIHWVDVEIFHWIGECLTCWWCCRGKVRRPPKSVSQWTSISIHGATPPVWLKIHLKSTQKCSNLFGHQDDTSEHFTKFKRDPPLCSMNVPTVIIANRLLYEAIPLV